MVSVKESWHFLRTKCLLGMKRASQNLENGMKHVKNDRKSPLVEGRQTIRLISKWCVYVRRVPPHVHRGMNKE